MVTTLKIHEDTKNKLNKFREYKNESYDEVIKKLIYIANNVKEEPELNEETIRQIEAARERIRKGQFITEEDMWKRLGIKDV